MTVSAYIVLLYYFPQLINTDYGQFKCGTPFAKRQSYEERLANSPPVYESIHPFVKLGRLIDEFNVLFVLNENFTDKSKQRLAPVFENVNRKLSDALYAPRLKEIRRHRSNCSEPATCGDIEMIPKQFVMPCPNDIDKNVTDYVARINNQSLYSLVIYVMIANETGYTEWCGDLVGYAQECQYDVSDNWRPTHGALILCSAFTKVKIWNVEYWTMVVLHEILHVVMGSDIPTMPTTAINGSTDIKLLRLSHMMNKTLKEVRRPWFTVSNNTYLGEKLFGLVTTRNVRRIGRKHFRCRSLDGVELEYMNSENASAPFNLDAVDLFHWSGRLFPDEILSPSAGYGLRFSALTLAALDDKGWYDVDYDVAEELWMSPPHPNADGCILAMGNCHDYIKNTTMMAHRLLNVFYRDNEPDRKESSPLCTENSTRCTVDGKIRYECKPVDQEGGCFFLLADEHPLKLSSMAKCSEVTEQATNLVPFLKLPVNDAICVTVTHIYNQSDYTKNQVKPPCVEYECFPIERSIKIKFSMTTGVECVYECLQSFAGLQFTYEMQWCQNLPRRDFSMTTEEKRLFYKLILFCPYYDRVCGTPGFSVVDVTGVLSSPQPQAHLSSPQAHLEGDTQTNETCTIPADESGSSYFVKVSGFLEFFTVLIVFILKMLEYR